MKLRASQWVTIWVTVAITIILWLKPAVYRWEQQRQNRVAIVVLIVGALLTWQLSAFDLGEVVRRLTRRQAKR